MPDTYLRQESLSGRDLSTVAGPGACWGSGAGPGEGFNIVIRPFHS
jgi:hypothetical protein